MTGVAALCATTLFSAGLVAQQQQEEKKAPKASDKAPQAPQAGQEAPSAHEQAMMEAWSTFATPGAPHAELALKVGTWRVDGKAWHDPESVPEEFGGTATFKMIMDGRFLLEKVKGDEQGGMIFEGIGIIGFDNMTQKYVTTWIDNMGTGIMSSEGTAGRDGTINFTGQHPDFIAGKYKNIRSTERRVGDTYVHTMYDKTADGVEFRMFEVIYTRIADEPAQSGKPDQKKQ